MDGGIMLPLARPKWVNRGLLTVKLIVGRTEVAYTNGEYFADWHHGGVVA